ncbi:caveolae-associated protein 4 [Dipodomys spectabilis]|uniref:caveolae-associated protein 4 n=1 Tax=Dipodomys spectabilis TaxID=105255 RepID=UPI001C538620|nr:caveolae-associated protein 4 [Dipodomys spectabilis]
MEHNGSASNGDKIHQNRLSSVTEDEDQDAALTIVTVLDKVATIVDSVQASQKRIEERHREMENAIKSVQIDLLKLSQSHSNTGYVVNKLFEKTRKVSAHIKDVKARVEKQQVHVTKVETKQEEIMKKNKFRVVIFQEKTRCPTSLSIVRDKNLTENQEEEEDEIFDPPIDLSSDEEYYVEESRSARFRKSGKERIDHIKKAFSKESMQKTRQNFDKKVNRIRTRIVTPERRERLRQSGERLRQSGERLRQSGERFKKSISNAAPSKEAFKMRSLRKAKDTKAEGQEVGRDMGVDIIAGSPALDPIHELHPNEFSETEEEAGRTGYVPQVGSDFPTPEPLKVTFKPQVRVEDDESLLLDLKQSS